jgi:mono/diheme cytochrome c family protein
MSKRSLATNAATALALSAVTFFSTGAIAQDLTLAQWTYKENCAVCHGLDGKGYGPVADILTTKPSNLTALAQQNDGVYPFGRVYQVIDGRAQVTGHGTTDMPVWGSHFRVEAVPATRHPGINAEEVVQGRILGLVYYIQTLQAM